MNAKTKHALAAAVLVVVLLGLGAAAHATLIGSDVIGALCRVKGAGARAVAAR